MTEYHLSFRSIYGFPRLPPCFLSWGASCFFCQEKSAVHYLTLYCRILSNETSPQITEGSRYLPASATPNVNSIMRFPTPIALDTTTTLSIPVSSVNILYQDQISVI